MTEHQGKRIVALGEVLWDVFEKKKHPGGAPLNFAFHASQFGHEAWIVSRIGRDDLGCELLGAIREMNLPTDLIQVDLEKPTGTVNVSVNLFGEPKFEIARDVAWDYIQAAPEATAIVLSADVIWYGMLAQRSKITRASIRALLGAARKARRDVLIVCELHLRQRFYSPELIRQSLEFCSVLRLNETELVLIKGVFGRLNATEREFARELMDTFGLLLVCVTRGPRGCTLHTPDAEVHAPGFVVDVVDTVGTGRAFTAAMVTKLVQGARFIEVARYANLAGAYVATQPGATPRFTPYTLQQFEMEIEGGRSIHG